MTAVVLGVDSSTQSCKVELRETATGRLVAAARAPHPATTPPVSEQDPAAWWAALVTAANRALGQLSGPTRVEAVAVAGQQHGLVLVDEAGSVVRPAKLWNDTTSAPQAAALVDRLGPKVWAAACGSVPLASFTVSKLAWIAANEPDALDRTRRILLPHDWLTSRLTGRAVTDRGDASGTGYWSPAEGRWRPDLLALVDPRPDWAALLPEVLGPYDGAGPLRPDAAAALGIDGEPLVAAGTGDNMAAALGLGLAQGDVAISLGTSGTVFAVSDRPAADPTGVVAGFADATGRFLPLVCTLNATRVTDWMAAVIGADETQFDALALAAPPGSRGVTMLPYLDGERTPNRPDATAVLTGLRGDTGRAELARAAVEGVACGLLDGLDVLTALAATEPALVLIGGGARSVAYQRVIAGLAGRTLLVPEADEVVALGACVQAAALATGRDAAAVAHDWHLRTGHEVEPDPDDLAVADEVRDRYATRRLSETW